MQLELGRQLRAPPEDSGQQVRPPQHWLGDRQVPFLATQVAPASVAGPASDVTVPPSSVPPSAPGVQVAEQWPFASQQSALAHVAAPAVVQAVQAVRSAVQTGLSPEQPMADWVERGQTPEPLQ